MCNALGIDRNPITLVRQSTARRAIPRVLTPEEFRALLKELGEPYKTMVLTAGCLGLRASELMGLQWGDIDWNNLTVFIRRSATGSYVYETKTEGSSKPVPLDPNLAEVLLGHGERSSYRAPTDFISLGSPAGRVGEGFYSLITSSLPRKGQGSAR